MLSLLLLACAPEATDTDTGTEQVVVHDSGPTCDNPVISHDLADAVPPSVGDSWTITGLTCENDGLHMGASHITVTPAEAANVNEAVITWELAGDADLFVQVGTFKTTETITVQE